MKKGQGNVNIKSKQADVEKLEDVKKLVELLQIHQVELEHQNEELRITQEELEVSRNKYVKLFDFSPIPYFTLDINGVIKETNLSASYMVGISRNKMIGKNFISYILPDSREIYKHFIKTVFDSSTKHSCELKVLNNDKQVFYVLLEGINLENALESDQKCQIALIDMTGYKKIEASIKETNKELNKLNATKDKLFSIIAHDLKSPFLSLLGSSELIATEIDRLSKEKIKVLSKGLNKNLVNLFDLLNNLLNWSLTQRDMIDYNPLIINLNEMINKMIQATEHVAVKKDISVSNNIDMNIYVFADANMLRSVIQNLIMNALKFNQPGGKVFITSVKNGDFVEVSIEDTGVGIAPEKSSEIFDFNTSNSTYGTAGEKGTGLGLPLCKEFVERNNGRIWVESESGKGSKFTFTLPYSVSPS